MIRCRTVYEGGGHQSPSGHHREHLGGCLGARKDVCLHLDEIDDSFVIAEQVDDYRSDDDELLPYEARSRNRPKDILATN